MPDDLGKIILDYRDATLVRWREWYNRQLRNKGAFSYDYPNPSLVVGDLGPEPQGGPGGLPPVG